MAIFLISVGAASILATVAFATLLLRYRQQQFIKYRHRALKQLINDIISDEMGPPQ